MTNKDVWKKIFDEDDYQRNRIQEVTIKLREDTTADHFRYNYDNSSTVYKTTTSGFSLPAGVQKVYAYVPDVDAQVFEIEVIYK